MLHTTEHIHTGGVAAWARRNGRMLLMLALLALGTPLCAAGQGVPGNFAFDPSIKLFGYDIASKWEINLQQWLRIIAFKRSDVFFKWAKPQISDWEEMMKGAPPGDDKRLLPYVNDATLLKRKASEWNAFKAQAAGKRGKELLQFVNTFWNKMKYEYDNKTWQKPDYWAVPAEFALKNKGDCEDYAIAKYYTLKELGVPAEAMRIVIGRIPPNEAHAILVVFLDGDAFVLDNRYPVVRSHSKVSNFKPSYSVNDFLRWNYWKLNK